MRKKINWILGGLIALLGGCKSSLPNTQPKIVVMYGVPYASYNISGKVINEQNQPIEGASITIKGFHNRAMGDIIQTDKTGKFHLETSGMPTDSINIVVSTTELMDSVQHATSYQTQETTSGFYRGTCEIETTVTLKK
jgi:putative lipoprotein (rSAM/lipoprotein system)